ncbi:MAG: hypothetical protein E3J90_06765 [Promethearchaeota archaeon]|nr:MAG: hypothetical protein E3J90_06765 [Candidatus Lokiarchaeota archaeon]
METLQAINELKIETNKIFYDKKTQILSVYILDFIFIGNYKKNAKLGKVLDDIYKSFGDTQLNRENISFVDFVTLTPISEKTKLKNLNLISKKEKEDKKEKAKEKEIVIISEEPTTLSKNAIEKDSRKKSGKTYDFQEKKERMVDAPKAKKKGKRKESKAMKYLADEESIDEDMFMEEDRKFGDAPSESFRSTPPPPARPSVAPGGGPPKVARESVGGYGEAAKLTATEDEEESLLRRDEAVSEEPQTTTYDINMGLQYYSVMMEQSSYLFYVYLSHKELKIVDEEGKTVFETSFKIVTTKKEPPIVDLKVEGEGFEVHPLHGKVEIKKDAINPPVMIFSVLPVRKKDRTKKDKKLGERRYLHVYIEFEENIINHSVLSIIVQPKHFRLDIGPFHLNISKKVAVVISFLSVIIAVGSLIYTLFSLDPTSTAVDFMGNFAPGIGSIVFIVIFLITLFKEGIYPLKEKISYFLNFDNTGLIK